MDIESIENIIPTMRINCVQRRIHKKRRINKKWRKKYGMRWDIIYKDKIIRDVKFELRRTTSTQYYSDKDYLFSTAWCAYP